VLLNEHVWWDRLHGRGLDAWPGHANDRAPERRLRVGYVSPDFRAHPVARFVLPIYEAHDRAQVEVYSYARVRRLDEVSERLRARSDVWRATSGLPDAEVAALVRADQIDVLVDLGGHTTDGCLGVFTVAASPRPGELPRLSGNDGPGGHAVPAHRRRQ
jgi:predicted O-linked N-acetylglucosamine transferase (SPINDLY family)